MKSLPVAALRYGGALSSISKMQVQLGSLKCSGKKGIYPSEIEQEEKRALEKRLNIFNETLRLALISIPSLPSGYKAVKSDFGMVAYKLYKDYKIRSEALSKCTNDASFLHFPQPSNKQENLFYYDLIYPSAIHTSHFEYLGAMWLDISKSNSWTNWREGAPSASGNPYTTMSFKTGAREKNWNRVPTSNKYMFLCTAVFN